MSEQTDSSPRPDSESSKAESSVPQDEEGVSPEDTTPQAADNNPEEGAESNHGEASDESFSGSSSTGSDSDGDTSFRIRLYNTKYDKKKGERRQKRKAIGQTPVFVTLKTPKLEKKLKAVKRKTPPPPKNEIIERKPLPKFTEEEIRAHYKNLGLFNRAKSEFHCSVCGCKSAHNWSHLTSHGLATHVENAYQDGRLRTMNKFMEKLFAHVKKTYPDQINQAVQTIQAEFETVSQNCQMSSQDKKKHAARKFQTYRLEAWKIFHREYFKAQIGKFPCSGRVDPEENFSSSGWLTKVHYDPSSQKQICPLCGIYFAEDRVLSKHLQDHKTLVPHCEICKEEREKILPNVNALERFQCLICKKQHRRRERLEEHLENKHFVKPFSSKETKMKLS